MTDDEVINELLARYNTPSAGGAGGVDKRRDPDVDAMEAYLARTSAPKRMPDLRSYDPPWYQSLPDKAGGAVDKVRGALGYEPMGPEGHEWMRKLFGTENPLNLPGQVHEGYHTASRGLGLGDHKQAGLGALQMAMALPFGVGKGKLPANALAARADAAAAQPSIRAFHGSPHDFDRFEAPAYFTPHESEARNYKNDGGSGTNLTGKSRPVEIGYSDAAYALDDAGGNRAEAIKAIDRQLTAAKSPMYKGADEPTLIAAKELLKTRGEFGKMYEVRIPPPTKDFIDPRDHAAVADSARADGHKVISFYGGSELVALDPSVIEIIRKYRKSGPLDSHGIMNRTNEAGYEPPIMPQRAFTDDYRGTTQGLDGSPLKTDIEGRPLTAKFVAGRRRVGENDVGLTPSEIAETAKTLGEVSLVPKGRLGNAVGEYIPGVNHIAIDSSLPKDQKAIALSHELGHLLADNASVPVSLDGSAVASRKVYHDLHTGDTSAQMPGRVHSPEFDGYRKGEVPGELIAEMLRAYMMDPNYIKTVAPKGAAAIRASVNADPWLSKIIQFNALPPIALGAGAAGLGVLDQYGWEK